MSGTNAVSSRIVGYPNRVENFPTKWVISVHFTWDSELVGLHIKPAATTSNLFTAFM